MNLLFANKINMKIKGCIDYYIHDYIFIASPKTKYSNKKT